MLGSDRITTAVTVACTVASRTASAAIGRRRGKLTSHSLEDQTVSQSYVAASFTEEILC
jgi:hypothetical protein